MELKDIPQNEIKKLINNLYDKAIKNSDAKDGGGFGAPMEQSFTQAALLAHGYIYSHDTIEKAAKSFIRAQIAKGTTVGVASGLGGFLTFPVAVLADVAGVLYLQIQTIVCLAYMSGYDIESDEIRTLVFACLAGVPMGKLLRDNNIHLEDEFAQGVVESIPSEVLAIVNQKVVFRLAAKFCESSACRLGKTLPIVSSAISGTYDALETHQISCRAYRLFIKKELDALE